ncbi:MAG TPA: FCD domain-containing protein, partial [Ktedonobacterales bacterium]
DMYEVFLIRNVLERITFRRTAQTITPEACDELQALIDKMLRAADQDDIISVLNFDMQFHTNICQWSGNHTLLSVWAPLRAQIQRFVVQHYQDYFSNIQELALSHQPLVDALRANDVERAVQEIETHVMRAWSGSSRDTATSTLHDEH